MNQNLTKFGAVAVLISTAFMAVDSLINHLPSGLQGVVSLAYLFLFIWVYFGLIVKIIYRMAGVYDKGGSLFAKQKPVRLTHQQASTVNRYWIVWLASSVATGAVFTALFDRRHWKGAVVFGLLVSVIVALSYVNNRQKLMGHTKKEIFK